MTCEVLCHPASIQSEFVQYAIAQRHPLISEWQTGEDSIRKRVEQEVALLSDMEIASQYAQTMHVLALTTDQFRARLIQIDEHRFLARIDFPDTSGIPAFVDIFGARSSPGSLTDADILRKLARNFSEFSPSRVRFYHPSHLPLQLPGARIDQHFLAAPASTMAKHDGAKDVHRVALADAPDLSFYSRYVEAYEEIYSERPHLRDVVTIESEESLAVCLSQQLLFQVLVDDCWAGTVAARQETHADLDSIYMVDIVLDRANRGQGLGPAVHQQLAQRVVARDPFAILSGTIAPSNLPSLKTARRIGRMDVGTWCWLDL